MTVKFQTLVMTTEWGDLQDALIRLYPDQEKNIYGYEDVYYELLTLERVDNDMFIHISFTEEEWGSWFEVHGRNGSMNEHHPDLEQTFALEFTPWEEWLDMDVHYMTMEKYANVDILAHCMYELTRCGFTQGQIKEQLDELDRRIKSIEDGTAKTYSWDEIKDRIKKKLGFDIDDSEDNEDSTG
jgi:hypothetical protein